ncbi:MAG: biotin-dependent carboxyltransferase family protein [Flavobacteriaceae bacterium]|nr:biotin-dependent carboxyltransferase family protein [Flavobacteriaceae bacterium]
MIEVLKAGLYCSIQDLGRFGYRDIGVSTGGAMDEYAATLANKLVGNSKDMAVMEITLIGPKLKFHKTARIAVCGADFLIKTQDACFESGRAIDIVLNTELSIVQRKKGVRAYLAVAGGFDTPMVLGSRSFFQPITPKARLEEGDRLPLGQKCKTKNSLVIENIDYESSCLEVFPGPEFALLEFKHLEKLFTRTFKVSTSNNRMGCQLDNPIPSLAFSMITSAVLPGTVQLTPSGKLIVLMKDAQTTGGYPRILQLNKRSIARLSQKIAGSDIRFVLCLPTNRGK